MLQGATVNYLQGLAAEKVKEIADKLGSETARTALQAIVGCAGAAAQGADCGSAALGAGASVVISNLLYGANSGTALSGEEKEKRERLISSLVAGASVAAGGQAAVAMSAAQIEAENNYLSATEAMALDQALQGCQKKGNCTAVWEKFKEINEKNRAELDATCQKTPLVCADLVKQIVAGGIEATQRPAWLFNAMDTEEARAFVLRENEKDLARIDATTPGWMSFVAFVGDPENQLALASLGNAGKELVKLARSALEGVARKGTSAPLGHALARSPPGIHSGGGLGNDVGRTVVPKSAGVVNEIPQITLNRQSGIEFERQVIEALGHVGARKNTTLLTTRLPNGAQATTIPDLWGKNVGGMLEVKNVQRLSMSNQLRTQIQIARDTGQPLNIVVSPKTINVSMKIIRKVRRTGGDVYRYNPKTGDLTKF